MEEQGSVKMIERVTVRKFDKEKEDNPTVPFEVVTQETVTNVSPEEALLMGWVPKDSVGASGTVKLDTGDGAEPHVGD